MSRPDTTVDRGNWGGVLAMTLCVFALIASEFMPVSLLTPLAADLGVTEGLAGYGIAISGAFAVLTSLSISALAGTMDRKTLLLALTVLMGVSGATVAFAPNTLTYMAGRALLGVEIGGFWSMSAAMAMRLVPPVKCRKPWRSSTAAMPWRRSLPLHWEATWVRSSDGEARFSPWSPWR